MKRAISATAILALGLALAGCGSTASSQPAKTVTVKPTSSASTTAQGTGSDSDSPSSSDVAYPGASSQVHKFGESFKDSAGMGMFTFSKVTPGEAVSSDDRDSMQLDPAVKRWAYFTVSLENLTKNPIETDGLSEQVTVGQAESTCALTGQDFGGTILPGRTRVYKMQCGADAQGRLTYELDSANLGGMIAIYTNEP
jgi:hypothetical protein